MMQKKSVGRSINFSNELQNIHSLRSSIWISWYVLQSKMSSHLIIRYSAVFSMCWNYLLRLTTVRNSRSSFATLLTSNLVSSIYCDGNYSNVTVNIYVLKLQFHTSRTWVMIWSSVDSFLWPHILRRSYEFLLMVDWIKSTSKS